MAHRASMAARNVNGEFITPDVRLLPFINPSDYFVECTIVNAADLSNASRSASFFIEWLDEPAATWRCGGGAHFLGSGDPLLPAPGVIRLTTGRRFPDGTKRDLFSGMRVRLRVNVPAIEYDSGQPLFPGTSGPVRISLALDDERAS